MEKVTARDIAMMIDLSLLNPTFTEQEVVDGLNLAKEYNVVSVCVRPCDVELANEMLKDCDTKVTTVIGFPHGTCLTETKVFETEQAIDLGCVEVDVVQNISYTLSGDELDDAIRSAAAFAGLKSELLEKSPFDLSGGEKRRAAIAGVMAMQPRVLILDEPTAGLDPMGRSQMLDRIMDYRSKTGSSIVLVSHTMEDVARCADRVLVLNHGKVQKCATPSEVFGDAEMLEASGLRVPDITKVFVELNKLGVPADTSIHTVDKGVAELLRLFGKAGEQRA